MKDIRNIVHIALSLLVLLVASYPCTDRYQDASFTQNYSVSLEDHNHTQQDSGDTCSPLCTCNCCATSITLALSLKLPKENTPSINKEVVYAYYKTPKNISLSIWQPPRLS